MAQDPMAHQQKQAGATPESHAHEAELALFRNRLAQVAYRLGLHESSIVRELGSVQVDAVRSLRGAAALPRRMWQLLNRVRRARERQDLDEHALRKFVEQALEEYRACGFAGADAFVSAQFLTMRERAHVYAGLAAALLPLSGRDAARSCDVALTFDHDPSLVLRLVLLKQEAGQLASAVETLARLPAAHPTSVEEEEAIARLRGFARLALRPPVIPRRGASPARAEGTQSVLLVWEAQASERFGDWQRLVWLSGQLTATGMQVCLVVVGPDAPSADLRGGYGPATLDGVRVMRLEASPAQLAPDEWFKVASRELGEVARASGATLVHVAGTYRVGMPALLAARAIAASFVYERLAFPEYRGAERTADWRLSELFQLEQSLEALVCEHADMVLVGSRKQAEEVRRRVGAKQAAIQQLPLPVPVDEVLISRDEFRREYGIDDDDLVVGFIHAGRRFEGLGDLVEALAARSSAQPALRLLVLSCGGLDERERQRLAMLPGAVVADRLDARGLASGLSACNLAAFPWQATAESDLASSAGVLQAMAAGVPVLVSTCFAFSDVAQDGVNARVHAAGNSQAIGRCLEDLVEQKSVAVRMAAAARAAMRHDHSWSGYIERLMAAYRDASGQVGVDAQVQARNASLPGVANRSRLRVAAIMDEFTHSCFAAECELVQLTPGDWHAQITELDPDFLLVESAWQGHKGEWEKQIPQASTELRKLIVHCRRKGIRTAFWNKEDPVHFSLFLGTAQLFDTVFTTDIDRIKSYREKLGHDRVYLLPFACQPQVHNPIERYERLDAFCFAGSYYAKYPERREDFAQLVGAAASFRKVEIFDRNHGKQDPGLLFPPEYQDLVVGTLPVSEIDRAYKGYRFGITVNTVKQSQSMFARRAFELLACNTLTISNFSRGLKLLLGDLVICGGSAASISAALRKRAGDEQQARRFRLVGLRKVMDEHTYAHRMAYLAGKVLGRDTTVPVPPVVVLRAVSSQAAVDEALAVFDEQSAVARRLVLVVDDGLLPLVPVRADVSVLTRHQAGQVSPAERWPDAHVAVFDPRDHYAKHYLKDLQLAARYAATAAVGKVAHYVSRAVPELVGDGTQYRIHEIAWPLRRSLVASGALMGLSIVDLLAADFEAPVMTGLATDEFNYCAGGAGSSEAAVVDSDIAVDEGMSMDALLQIAEATVPGSDTATPETHPGFHGDGLQKLFAPAVHGDGLLQVSHSLEGVVLESRLSTKQHAYAYASRLFKPAELVEDGVLRFQLVTDAGLYVNAAVVYLDAARNKLSHAIVSSDTNQALPVPPATVWIRFGLRILGPGVTTVRALVKGSLAPALDHIIGRGDALLITKDYPRYEDLYRYGFVHRRILAYSAAGREVDVFRFSNAPLRFDEFEGVSVVAGQAEHLRMLLDGGAYDTVLVHAMDPLMWEHVKPLLESRRVVIWVHGAEIQPWFRRLSNVGADPAARDMARRASQRRLAMWAEVLRHPHPNLRVVFVSRYLEEQALGDLGVRLPPGQVHVIPNYVDGELFRYEQKDPALRGRILSIRPFASPVYANDLTVEAIRILSEAPFFDRLEFTIIGDGPLFDATVEPLRQYPNVRIEKKFLSQAEIAALHREHGVFLVPSRMDSQGVSRDEAMSSGLVPVTTRVAAIPEFVDDESAILADPEDAKGLADGIARLWLEPDLFQRMSAAAAARVRRISGSDNTIGKELVLLEGGQPARAIFHAASPARRQRIAIYGDVNLNITDGSAIWAVSLAEVLAGLPEVHVTLYLKAMIVQTHIIAPLLSIPGLRIVEPSEKAITPPAALDMIERDDEVLRYDAVVLRGMDLCTEAAARAQLHGRLWVYLTDVPQAPGLATPQISAKVERIIDASAVVLCQTPQFRDYMETWMPAAVGKTRLLPPMVPAMDAVERAARHEGLRIVYAGKFAPLWGGREMLDTVAALRASGNAVTLHVYGDKIHNPSDDPEFRGEIARRLEGDEGVVWHGAVERGQLLGELQQMDVGWAWRHAALEECTHELSTKLLEYASAGVPPIMVRNAVNLSVFGPDYPLYADSLEEAAALLARLATDPDLRARAVDAGMAASRQFDFDSVRRFLGSQDLVPSGPPDPTVPHHPWVSV